ncbi:MAG: helix-turn-helix domain-containing protein [Acidobacteriota bacterium]|nr:helix-turn-helix domain-containing protein [Acidobacteriota bacterium]
MQLTIPNTDDIRAVVDAALIDFFSSYQIQSKIETDDIGKGAEFASKIVGKAVPTIYDLVHKRLIPHFKQGKDLYFSRKELTEWLKSGKRKTQGELALDAENFSSNNSNSKTTVAA